MSEPLFYIQNKGFCGNCLLWWRVDGSGYTMNLDEAWKVTKEQADSICRSRPHQDVAHSVEKIDALAHRHVNCERLRLAEGTAAIDAVVAGTAGCVSRSRHDDRARLLSGDAMPEGKVAGDDARRLGEPVLSEHVGAAR